MTNGYQNKGRSMIDKIMTFLKGPWRVLTNAPTEGDLRKVQESKDNQRPVHDRWIKDRKGKVHPEYIMSVATGDWTYSLLEHHLNKRNIKFRLGIVANKELQKYLMMGVYKLDDLLKEANFAWANASYTFILKLEDRGSDFDPSELGLEVFSMKKTVKRLQEVTRLTQMYSSGKFDELDHLMITKEEHPEMDPLYFDGPIFVRKSFAVKACFPMPDGHEKRKFIAMINRDKMGPMIGRLNTPYGLIKGLVHVVDDLQLHADVVYHETALKREIRTNDDKWYFTAFRHECKHTAMWDMQTTYNNHTWLMTEERFLQDLQLMVADFTMSVESGILPDGIIYHEGNSHKDDGVPQINHEAEGGWKNSYIRWQLAGLDVRDSSNILYMAFGALVNQMRQAAKNGRWWVPLSNAVMATVTTRESLELMGGFDFPDKPRNKVFFDERFGVVIPGDRFVQTSDLHDTWDQDGDQAKFIHIKLWSSSPDSIFAAKRGHVIPADLEVPCTPEDAIDVCVVIRSPNGPGGYSIERFDEASMQFMRAASDRIPVIDLKDSPPAMSTLLEKVSMGKIPTSVRHSDKLMTRDDAKQIILAQLNNPGVGLYANQIMFWSGVFGPSYPRVLPAIGNDIIDTVQQTADVASFKYITEELEHLAERIGLVIHTKGIAVDRFLFMTRMSRIFFHSGIEFPVLEEGKFSRMNTAFLEAIKKVEGVASRGTFRIRMESSPTKQLVMEKIPVLSPGVQAWARNFVMRNEKLLQEVDSRYKPKSGDDRFVKAMRAHERKMAMSEVVQSMYDEINRRNEPTKWAVALYRWIVDPTMTHQPYGVSDRTIFQNGIQGQETIMDLLIQGIKDLS
jgi:hypothetical protein